MTAKDGGVLASVLDKAIAGVARKELQRRSEGRPPREVSRRVDGALRALDGLRRGQQPPYDEWDSLFYLTWYQPRQVHLLVSLLQAAEGFPERSQVVDVGCGAGALQVALAFSMAEQPSKRAVGVCVSGIDDGRPMRRIGESLWLELRALAELDPALENLRDVMNDMSDRRASYSSYGSYARSSGAMAATAKRHPHWLTATHVVYEETREKLRRTLAEVCAGKDPDGILVTCDEHKEELLDQLFDVPDHSWVLRQVTPIWKGCLPCTTSWRQQVLADLDSPTDLCRNFLKGQVRWNPGGNPIKKDVARVWVRQ